MTLAFAFRAYRTRYGMTAADACRVARYVVITCSTIHAAWIKFDRGELAR